jgi:hypothetical protein
MFHTPTRSSARLSRSASRLDGLPIEVVIAPGPGVKRLPTYLALKAASCSNGGPLLNGLISRPALGTAKKNLRLTVVHRHCQLLPATRLFPAKIRNLRHNPLSFGLAPSNDPHALRDVAANVPALRERRRGLREPSGPAFCRTPRLPMRRRWHAVPEVQSLKPRRSSLASAEGI